jgi:hypothetical protein
MAAAIAKFIKKRGTVAKSELLDTTGWRVM